MIDGVPKSAIDSTKVRIAPVLVAGNTSGSVTLKKRCSGVQPSDCAASSYERLMLRSALSVIRYTYGKNFRLKTSTMPVAP